MLFPLNGGQFSGMPIGVEGGATGVAALVVCGRCSDGISLNGGVYTIANATSYSCLVRQGKATLSEYKAKQEVPNCRLVPPTSNAENEISSQQDARGRRLDTPLSSKPIFTS